MLVRRCPPSTLVRRWPPSMLVRRCSARGPAGLMSRLGRAEALVGGWRGMGAQQMLQPDVARVHLHACRGRQAGRGCKALFNRLLLHDTVAKGALLYNCQTCTQPHCPASDMQLTSLSSARHAVNLIDQHRTCGQPHCPASEVRSTSLSRARHAGNLIDQHRTCGQPLRPASDMQSTSLYSARHARNLSAQRQS